jgi:acetyltransferase
MALARDLIAQTRVSRLLEAFRAEPAADIDAVALTLVKLSQLSRTSRKSASWT